MLYFTKTCALIIISIFCIYAAPLAAQESDTLRYAEWRAAKDAPTLSQRAEDMVFFNEHTGWLISIDGDVWRMTGSSAGHQWEHIKVTSHDSITGKDYRAALRCIGFHADGKRGYCGVIDGKPSLYATIDSGKTWQGIQERISGDIPVGLCGMRVINDSIVYAVGRVMEPANFVRTTNGGKTWKGHIFDSTIATTLIDCHFASPDTGIAVGGCDGDPKTGKALILRTEDGGTTWQTVHKGDRIGDQCWKVFARTSTEWYVTVQAYSAEKRYLKTTDAGKTWSIHIFGTDTTAGTRAFPQGMIFTSEMRGFAGGWGKVYYETADGGKNWTQHILDYYINLNRFRRVNDSVCYSAGVRLYRWSPGGISSTESIPEFISPPPFPLPAQELVTLQLWPEADYAGAEPTATLVDAQGKIHYARITSGWEHPSIKIDVSELPSGQYTAYIRAVGRQIVRSFLVAR